MAKKARVTVVNPSKKKRRKTAKKGRKTMAKKRKKPTRRRRSTARRSNPAPKRRRRTRRRNPAPARRARRKNPTVTKFGKIDLTHGIKDDLARVGGMAAAAFAVTKWGDAPQAPATWPNGPEGYEASPTAGAGWSFKNYLFALLGGWVGGEIVARVWGQSMGQRVYEGARLLAMEKLLWTQLLSRTTYGPQWFGAVHGMGPAGYPTMPAQSAYPQMGAAEGDIYTDDDGNVWLNQGGRWVSMQGLVESGPLGALVETGPLGDTGSGYLPSSTPTGEADWAMYSQAGATDPYHASFAS